MSVVSINFEDFKKIALENNKRVYYYQNENILQLYYITEGMFIKSFLDLNTIENLEIFFGQKLFFGATKLLFNIPEDETRISISDVIIPPSIIEENAPDEVDGGEDIQKTGVE